MVLGSVQAAGQACGVVGPTAPEPEEAAPRSVRGEPPGSGCRGAAAPPRAWQGEQQGLLITVLPEGGIP